MENKTASVLHGFLNLNAKEKMELVSSINEYFDSTDRETLRAEADRHFEELRAAGPAEPCPCCGR